jgi:multidrug resistance efflux pump
MEQEKEITIDLKSEPMNEMLSNPPSWIVRSGNGLFLLIILLIVGLSWLIEYPDEINGEVTVTTKDPPIELSNQLYVQLKQLFVKEGQHVQKNQLLAQFDNQAKTTDIEKTERFVNELELIVLTPNSKLPTCPKGLQLGTFQQAWTVLETRIDEWNNLCQSNLSNEQMASILREITYRERLQTIASRKIKLSESEYTLIAEELKTSERLAQESAISKQSLNQDKRTETQAMQTVQSQKEQYVQNLIQLNSLRKELVVLKHDQNKQEQERVSGLKLALATLESQLVEWRKNAVWVAPCPGKIVFNKQLQLNQFYGANQASIVVVPTGNTFTAIASIESTGAGKVKKGQRAFIELVDYPKNEYGMIEGVVTNITQIDKEGKYQVRIRLPKQLKTTYKKLIPTKAQLKGTVKIITKKKRLLERFFEKLTDLIK